MHVVAGSKCNGAIDQRDFRQFHVVRAGQLDVRPRQFHVLDRDPGRIVGRVNPRAVLPHGIVAQVAIVGAKANALLADVLVIPAQNRKWLRDRIRERVLVERVRARPANADHRAIAEHAPLGVKGVVAVRPAVGEVAAVEDLALPVPARAGRVEHQRPGVKLRAITLGAIDLRRRGTVHLPEQAIIVTAVGAAFRLLKHLFADRSTDDLAPQDCRLARTQSPLADGERVSRRGNVPHQIERHPPQAGVVIELPRRLARHVIERVLRAPAAGGRAPAGILRPAGGDHARDFRVITPRKIDRARFASRSDRRRVVGLNRRRVVVEHVLARDAGRGRIGQSHGRSAHTGNARPMHVVDRRPSRSRREGHVLATQGHVAIADNVPQRRGVRRH